MTHLLIRYPRRRCTAATRCLMYRSASSLGSPVLHNKKVYRQWTVCQSVDHEAIYFSSRFIRSTFLPYHADHANKWYQSNQRLTTHVISAWPLKLQCSLCSQGRSFRRSWTRRGHKDVWCYMWLRAYIVHRLSLLKTRTKFRTNFRGDCLLAEESSESPAVGVICFPGQNITHVSNARIARWTIVCNVSWT